MENKCICGTDYKLPDGRCSYCVILSGAIAVELVKNNGEKLRLAERAKCRLQGIDFDEEEYQKEYQRVMVQANEHERNFPGMRVVGG